MPSNEEMLEANGLFMIPPEVAAAARQGWAGGLETSQEWIERVVEAERENSAAVWANSGQRVQQGGGADFRPSGYETWREYVLRQTRQERAAGCPEEGLRENIRIDIAIRHERARDLLTPLVPLVEEEASILLRERLGLPTLAFGEQPPEEAMAAPVAVNTSWGRVIDGEEVHLPVADTVEEEEEEEEEAEELEEFEYKGSTFYRDTNNNVFTLNDDGELNDDPVGLWDAQKGRLRVYTSKA